MINTLKLAESRGLAYQSYLAAYDSATFFKKLDLGIETGPTGTNVADVTHRSNHQSENPQNGRKPISSVEKQL